MLFAHGTGVAAERRRQPAQPGLASLRAAVHIREARLTGRPARLPIRHAATRRSALPAPDTARRQAHPARPPALPLAVVVRGAGATPDRPLPGADRVAVQGPLATSALQDRIVILAAEEVLPRHTTVVSRGAYAGQTDAALVDALLVVGAGYARRPFLALFLTAFLARRVLSE